MFAILSFWGFLFPEADQAQTTYDQHNTAPNTQNNGPNNGNQFNAPGGNQYNAPGGFLNIQPNQGTQTIYPHDPNDLLQGDHKVGASLGEPNIDLDRKVITFPSVQLLPPVDIKNPFKFRGYLLANCSFWLPHPDAAGGLEIGDPTTCSIIGYKKKP